VVFFFFFFPPPPPPRPQYTSTPTNGLTRGLPGAVFCWGLFQSVSELVISSESFIIILSTRLAHKSTNTCLGSTSSAPRGGDIEDKEREARTGRRQGSRPSGYARGKEEARVPPPRPKYTHILPRQPSNEIQIGVLALDFCSGLFQSVSEFVISSEFCIIIIGFPPPRPRYTSTPRNERNSNWCTCRSTSALNYFIYR